MRWIELIFGLLIAVAGFFCLNFTNGFGIDHHREWAAKHGMPAPSEGIFDAGILLLVVGGGVIGHGISRKRNPSG